MKLKVLKVLMLAAVFAAFSAVSLSSCIRDNVDETSFMDGVESGKPAVLSFNPIIEDGFGTPSTRAYTGGDSELEPGDGAQGSQAVGKAQDRNIEHVRVLMYKSSTGELVENLEFADVTPEQMPLTANVQTGRYDFVFLINSTSDLALKNKLNDEANYDNLSELVAMSITGGLNGGGGVYSTAMPMLQTVYGVDVLGNNRIRLPGSASVLEDTWQINPVRIKARLSVAMKLTKQQYSDLDAMEFRLSNLASNNYLFPKLNGDEGRDGNSTYFIYFNNPLAFTEIDESDPEFTTLYWHRVLLPELLFEDKDDKTEAMYIGVSKGGKAMQAPICAPAETGFGYTLPRNTWLHLNVTVKDNELQVTPQVIPWNTSLLADVLFDGKYSLSATPDLMTFVPDGGEQTLEVTTDYPDGWEIASTPSWITLDTDSSDVPGTVAVKATVTASSSSRQGTFVISAGRMRKTVKVAQLATIADSPVPANVVPYVGAFWKHNQTGERLIRIARPMVKSDGAATTAKQQAIIDGSWSATVIEGKEWIVLDTEASEDGGTWTDRPMMKGNDPGFDSRFAVSGDAVSVGGVLTPETPEQGIYFRIGLKNTIAADAVRYGVILLAYTNNASTPVINYQRIFVRQGEADDYLMRPTDAGGVLTSRPKAVKYSPYNLTSPEFMGNGVSLSEKEFVDVRPELRNGPSLAGFTEYPSQAGGFFLWSDKSGVNVYNPSGSGVRTKINASLSGTWFGADNHIGHTGTTAENHESCPAGYRRMIDGNENEFYDAISVDRSEANQSLFSTAFGGANGTGNTNNSVYGYYADGFFDRGSVGTESSLNDRKNTAVGVGRSTVAYSGRLFYNPASNNSIFFPITGAVQISNGQLSFTGMQGVYFSSGRGTSNNMVWMLDVQQTVAKRSLVNGNHYSAPIRCVVAATSLDVSPLSHTFDWNAKTTGASQEFTVTSDGAWAATITTPGNAGIFTLTPGTGASIGGTGASTVITGTGNGTFTIAPASDNTGTQMLIYTLKVTALGAPTTGATAPKTIAINYEHKPIPGVRNIGTAEGVIGYIHHPGYPDHHKLTMDKDNDGDDTNGIVYVAYFKFGSLVATSSEGYPAFTSDDIVAWPAEWKSTTDNRSALSAATSGSGATAWGKVPYVEFSTTDVTNYGRELMGHPSVADDAAKGDPCQYWDAQYFGGKGWRLPTKRMSISSAEPQTHLGITIAIPLSPLPISPEYGQPEPLLWRTIPAWVISLWRMLEVASRSASLYLLRGTVVRLAPFTIGARSGPTGRLLCTTTRSATACTSSAPACTLPTTTISPTAMLSVACRTNGNKDTRDPAADRTPREEWNAVTIPNQSKQSPFEATVCCGKPVFCSRQNHARVARDK